HAAALAGRDGALVLFLQRTGENDVGVAAGFGEEEIDAGVEIELLERLAGALVIGNRDERVDADGEQALNFSSLYGIQDFDGGQSLARQFALGDVPEIRDVLAVLGIFDVA